MTYNIDGFPSIIEYSIENSTINKDKNYYKVITPFYTLYKIPMNLHNLYFSEYEYKDILLKNAPFYLTENIKKLYEFHNKLPNLYSFFDNIILNIDNTNKINNNSLII
nr:hypothetical protein [Exilispira sp.]